MPVDIVCPSADPPMSTSGYLIRFTGTDCAIRLPTLGNHIRIESRIVISIVGPRGLRILGLVTQVKKADLEVRILRVVHKDKRDYPRVTAEINLRYHIISDQESEAVQTAWTRGIQEISHVIDWTTPNPFVNFSRSGLQFTGQRSCTVGQRMMLEIKLPKSEIIHRLTGTIVRVEELSEELRKRSFETLQNSHAQDTHLIAVQFERVANTIEEALSRATVEQQIREIEWRQAENSSGRT